MISRNLCFSTFVMDPKYLNIDNVNYENFKWDDQIEYKLNHTCEAIGKTGISKDKVCGKPAFFDVSNQIQLNYLKKEIQLLIKEQEELDDVTVIKKQTLLIKKKEKELKLFIATLDLFDNEALNNSKFYCRIHDPIKTSRTSDEKYQKKDVSYDYNVVQPNENGENKGVLPALLEELYSERIKVKKLMSQARKDNNKLLEDILNSTQLAIKVSLNSTYGFVGRKQGNLILKPLGQLTTYTGRQLIQQSKDYAEKDFIEYVQENNIATCTITTKQLDIPIQERDIILEQFKIKTHLTL